MIIAFYGRIGSGKTHATKLVTEHLRYGSARFGEPIKEMLAALLTYRRVGPAHIHRMLYGDLKNVRTHHLNGKSPREAMESLGDGWGREMMGEGRDFWIEAVDARGRFREMRGLKQDVVIEDVRRVNEANYVRACGGVVIGLTGGHPDRDVRSHASETEQVIVDHTIHNDFTAAFDEQVLALVRGLGA